MLNGGERVIINYCSLRCFCVFYIMRFTTVYSALYKGNTDSRPIKMIELICLITDTTVYCYKDCSIITESIFELATV